MSRVIKIMVLMLAATTTGSELSLTTWLPLAFVTAVAMLTVGSVLLLGADRRRTYKLLLEHTPPNTTLLDTGRRGQQVVCVRGGDRPMCQSDVIDRKTTIG